MKSNDVTRIIIFIFATCALCFAHSSVAQVTEENVWPDARRQVVTFAPQPTVTASLIYLGEGDLYSQFVVGMEYDQASITRQAREIQSRYPGYLIQRAVLEPSGNMTVRIPALNRTVTAVPRPSMMGPYIRVEEYLNRADTGRVRAAWGTSTAAVSGVVTANVPSSRVSERVQLEIGTCRRLGADGDTLFSVLDRYSFFIEQLRTRRYSNATTFESLKRSVLSECITFTERADSVGALLDARVQINESGTPTGQTFIEGVGQTTIVILPEYSAIPLDQDFR